MQFKRKNNIVQSVILDCFVCEQILSKLVDCLFEEEFIIEIASLERDSNFLKMLIKSDFPIMSKSYDDDYADVFVIVNKVFFANISSQLVECNAEVIVIYSLNKMISIEQFFYSNNPCFNPQKMIVKNRICKLVCTWVTNEDRLHFVFDTSKYNSDTIMSKMLS